MEEHCKTINVNEHETAKTLGVEKAALEPFVGEIFVGNLRENQAPAAIAPHERRAAMGRTKRNGTAKSNEKQRWV